MLQPDRTFASARFQDDQIVVAIPELRPVLARLESVGVPPAAIDTAEELGLARVSFSSEAVSAWGKKRPTTSEQDAHATLDALLDDLYAYFQHTFGGWTPTLGKNRAMDKVGGNHTIGVGDEGEPEPSPANLGPRSGAGGAGVAIGVADTVLHRSPWLDGAYLTPPDGLWPEAPGEAAPYQTGHAVFVVGTVLQQAPAAHVQTRKVLDDDGVADSWDVAKELVRFGRLGIDILNLSLGCFTGDNQPPLVLRAALDRLDPDIVVVAAAGNHADQMRDERRPLWPAALPRVVAVGATDTEGKAVAPWSPEPDGWPWVNVLAPGLNVTSTYISGTVRLEKEEKAFDGFATWSGTSFAAANVSGAVAAQTEPGRVSSAEALRLLLERHRRDDGIVWIP